MKEYMNNRLCGTIIICAAFVTMLSINWLQSLDARLTTRELKNRWMPRLMVSSSALEHNITRPARPNCNDTRLMAHGTFPLIALASFPGSGNTWVRHLIESATGIATGSLYNSQILKRNGFIGECRPYDSGETLTIKMHIFKNNLNGAILLLRNPYKALIAECNRRHRGKTGFATQETLNSFDFVKLLHREPTKWLKVITNYITTYKVTNDSTGVDDKTLLIVYYENLLDNLELEIRRILQFLHVQIDDDRLKCTLRNSEGIFHRKHVGISDPFKPQHRQQINKDLNAFCKLLDERGLPKPPKSFKQYPTTF